MRRIFTDRILGPGVIGATFKVAAVGVSFLFMKAVTQISGAEGWGLFTIIYTVALLAVSVARLGVDTALVKTLGQATAMQQYHRMSSALRQSTVAVFGVGVGLALLLWVLAHPLATAFGKPELGPYLRIAAFWIPFWAPLFLFTESLRGLGRTAAYMFLQNNLPYLLGALLLLPALVGLMPVFTPDIALITYGFGLMVSSVVGFVVLRRVLHSLQVVKHKSHFPIRTLQKTALPILSTYLLALALGMADVLLLGYLTPSAADTGVYALALRLSFLVLMPLHALGAVTAAGIAGLHAQGDHSELAATLRKTGRIVRAATLPLWLGLCVLSPWIMEFFGQGFVKGWPIVVILATNQFFNALCGPTEVLLQMTGKERIYRNLLAFALLVTIATNYVLIPMYGIWGAAIAQSITLFTWNMIGVVRIKRIYGVWLLRVW
jgi:O-antigen/teichoic acid export membrane protein